MNDFYELDEPEYRGEDGDYLIVRGDISKAEAAERMAKFEGWLTGEVRVAADYLNMLQTGVCDWGEHDGGEQWILRLGSQAPDNAVARLEVWVAAVGF